MKQRYKYGPGARLAAEAADTASRAPPRPLAHSAHRLSLAGVKQQLEMVRPGLGIFSVFICLRGTKKDLGLQATNYYVYFDTDMDKA